MARQRSWTRERTAARLVHVGQADRDRAGSPQFLVRSGGHAVISPGRGGALFVSRSAPESGRVPHERRDEIEQGEISVDELSEKVKRAAQLIKICKLKLATTEEDVNKILKELDTATKEDEGD